MLLGSRRNERGEGGVLLSCGSSVWYMESEEDLLLFASATRVWDGDKIEIHH
jgi:hypothetical protein